MSAKNSYLFVGGVRDGTRLCVEGDRVEFPVLEDFAPTYTPADCDIMRMVPFRTERYRSMRLTGFHHDYTVFAEESLGADEVLEALIRNYSGEEKK